MNYYSAHVMSILIELMLNVPRNLFFLMNYSAQVMNIWIVFRAIWLFFNESDYSAQVVSILIKLKLNVPQFTHFKVNYYSAQVVSILSKVFRAIYPLHN